MRQRMHTGCSCQRCSNGKDKPIRKQFHRLVRRIQKMQLRRDNDITDVDKSIGWTD